jgi:hypothetical protein
VQHLHVQDRRRDPVDQGRDLVGGGTEGTHVHR